MLPRRRLLSAAVAVLVSLGSLLAAAAAPAPSAAAARGPSARVTIDSQTPVVDASTKRIRFTGRVTNTGDVPLWTVNAMLWIDESPLTSRRQVARAAAERPGQRLGIRLDEPWNLVDEVATTLQPRASARFDVVVPVDELDLDGAGVYVAGVDIRATPADSTARETWRARSFLPYIPKGTTMTPVEVSFLLPLTRTPSLVAGDTFLGSGGDTTGAHTSGAGDAAFGDAALNLTDFAPDGRLTRLLELGAAYDLSFVVDPELLAEAERIADGAKVNGVRVDADQTRDVQRWLNRARGILGAEHTLMLPYADPDLPALERAHLTDRFGRAVDAAERAVRRYHASGTIAWPGEGYADAETLETIAGTGINTVLLSGNALPELRSDGSAPVASLATPDGALSALAIDPTLTAGGPGGQRSGLSIRQRFLAETALLALQDGGRPSAQRRVVAMLPRTWNPGGSSGSGLLSVVESTPWLRPLSAAALLSQPPMQYGGPLAGARDDERASLDSDVVDALHRFATTIDTRLDLLAQPEESRAELDLMFLRGTSMAWRRAPDEAVDLIDAMDDNVQASIDDVTVIPPRLITLSSQSGRFPVTIWNRGEESVHVQLEVGPREPGLITIEPLEPVRVDRNRRVTVSVTAETSASGAAQMYVRLATPTGTEFGPTETFQVRVTGYGQFGWAVIGVGLGLLLLATLGRVVKRVRSALAARPADATEPAETTDLADATDPQGTTEPGDPTRSREPDEPAEPPHPGKPADAMEPAGTAEPAGPEEPAETVAPADAVGSAVPREPTDTTDERRSADAPVDEASTAESSRVPGQAHRDPERFQADHDRTGTPR